MLPISDREANLIRRDNSQVNFALIQAFRIMPSQFTIIRSSGGVETPVQHQEFTNATIYIAQSKEINLRYGVLEAQIPDDEYTFVARPQNVDTVDEDNEPIVVPLTLEERDTVVATAMPEFRFRIQTVDYDGWAFTGTMERL